MAKKSQTRSLRDSKVRQQKTKPKTDAEPVEIPVPERKDVKRDLLKIAKVPPPENRDRAED